MVYSTASDYRLKENVKVIANALDKINRINPVEYNSKTSPTRTTGFLAHDIQAVLPETTSGEKDEIDLKGSPKYQTVDYGRVTPLLLAGIQELNFMLSGIKQELATLKN